MQNLARELVQSSEANWPLALHCWLEFSPGRLLQHVTTLYHIINGCA